jgi:hypothetical protein
MKKTFKNIKKYLTYVRNNVSQCLGIVITADTQDSNILGILFLYWED